LDTRTIPFPGERDRTCDTVARLDREDRQAEPVACIVEQAQHGSSDEFWKPIVERRKQPAVTRSELEQMAGQGG
jgi:hypothetical protein